MKFFWSNPLNPATLHSENFFPHANAMSRARSASSRDPLLMRFMKLKEEKNLVLKCRNREIRNLNIIHDTEFMFIIVHDLVLD